MDLKELITKINEGLSEDIESVNEDLLDDNIIKASENMGVQDMINMLLHIIESYVSEQTIKNIRNQFTLALASELNKSVNEANSYTDSMLDGINVANKTINSDLEFNVQVKEVNGGVAFNANGTGVQYHPYKPVDHEASKEELADVVNRCAEVIENKINELEDEIIGIFNERGFRK